MNNTPWIWLKSIQKNAVAFCKDFNIWLRLRRVGFGYLWWEKSISHEKKKIYTVAMILSAQYLEEHICVFTTVQNTHDIMQNKAYCIDWAISMLIRYILMLRWTHYIAPTYTHIFILRPKWLICINTSANTFNIKILIKMKGCDANK